MNLGRTVWRSVGWSIDQGENQTKWYHFRVLLSVKQRIWWIDINFLRNSLIERIIHIVLILGQIVLSK